MGEDSEDHATYTIYIAIPAFIGGLILLGFELYLFAILPIAILFLYLMLVAGAAYCYKHFWWWDRFSVDKELWRADGSRVDRKESVKWRKYPISEKRRIELLNTGLSFEEATSPSCLRMTRDELAVYGALNDLASKVTV